MKRPRPIVTPWPRKCSIEFEAAALLEPGASEPSTVLYCASFRRSLTDSRRVTMRGRIYRVGGFWKRRELVGQFKGYRRLAD